MARIGHQKIASCCIPDFDRAIAAARSDPRTIGGEDRAMHAAGMSNACIEKRPRHRVTDVNGLTITR